MNNSTDKEIEFFKTVVKAAQQLADMRKDMENSSNTISQNSFTVETPDMAQKHKSGSGK